MADVEIKARVSVDTSNATTNLKSVKNEIAGTGSVFSNLQKELKGMGPQFGEAAKASNIFNQALNVLKANPIILVLSALAGVIVVLFERFKKMEAVTDSLGKVAGIVSGVFERFLNGVLTPLVDGFTKIVELVGDGLITVFDALGISSKETSEQFGEITEALDDLEDAQRKNTLALAESNRKLAEAREIAADANLPIKQRIAALREAGEEEKKQLDNVVEYNRQKAMWTLKSIAMEMNARSELIDKIKEGSIESLKAVQAELLASKVVDKAKVDQVTEMIKAAEDAGTQRAKISKKTEGAITSIEREEQSKRDAANKDTKSRRKAAAKESDEAIKKEAEETKKAVEEATKIVHDAELSLMNKFDADRVKAREEYQKKIEALRKAGIEDTSAITREYRNALAAIEEARRADQAKKDQDEEAKNKEKQDKDIARLQAGQARMLGVVNAAQEQLRVSQEQADKDKIEAEKLKQAQIGETMALTQQLGDVIGQQTVAGKALGIATAVINTYQGASEALKQKSTLPSPFDVVAKVVNVATIIATGLRTVRAIAGVNVPAKGGGGGGASVSTPNISAPVTPTTTSTSLNASTIQAVGNAAAGGSARAYVVESDIANGQERIERLNRAARIG